MKNYTINKRQRSLFEYLKKRIRILEEIIIPILENNNNFTINKFEEIIMKLEEIMLLGEEN